MNDRFKNDDHKPTITDEQQRNLDDQRALHKQQWQENVKKQWEAEQRRRDRLVLLENERKDWTPAVSSQFYGKVPFQNESKSISSAREKPMQRNLSFNAFLGNLFPSRNHNLGKDQNKHSNELSLYTELPAPDILDLSNIRLPLKEEPYNNNAISSLSPLGSSLTYTKSSNDFSRPLEKILKYPGTRPLRNVRLSFHKIPVTSEEQSLEQSKHEDSLNSEQNHRGKEANKVNEEQSVSLQHSFLFLSPFRKSLQQNNCEVINSILNGIST